MIKEGDYKRNKKTGEILATQKVVVVCDQCGNEWATRYQRSNECSKKRDGDYCMSCINREILSRPGFKEKRIEKIRKWSKGKIKDGILHRNKKGLPLNLAANKGSRLYQAACRYFGNWNAALSFAGLNKSKIRLIAQYNIDDMKKSAEERNGKCLSDKYINSDSILKWQCGNGHVWEASAASTFYNKNWCPICANRRYINEERSRYIFEKLTDKKFPSNRKVLKNGQELDGYCDELKLAFEYHGEQHYKKIRFYNKKRNLTKIQKMDEKKRKKCKEKNITLIEIPYTVFEKKEEIRFITNQLTKNGVVVKSQEITYEDFWTNIDELKKYRKIAKERGGKLLSEVYIRKDYKLLWECAERHKWKAAPQSIDKHWCPACAHEKLDAARRLSMDKIRNVAISRRGKCLSETYKNNHILLEWQCQYGHIWETSYSSIRSGNWCPICSGTRKKTIEDMHKLAQKNQGKCLSKEYINAHTKLLWQCKNGHIFDTTPDSIQQGKWCRFCAGVAKYTIQQIKER